jgi:DNA polymerase elongation subunit (family B)
VMPRTLVFDIETKPIEAYVWKLFDENVGLDQIKSGFSILSYAAKWVGEKEIFYEDTGGRGVKKVEDDKRLVVSLAKLLDEADIVVGQNVKAFDIKKVNARMIMHNIRPYSPVRVVDTMLVARRVAQFDSKRLAWLSSVLTDTPKDDHKEFPGFSMWLECMRDNPKAWKEIKKYNIRDVVATEAVYMRLLPWIDNHPNAGVYIEDHDSRCTRCGSAQLQWQGYRQTQQGKYQRFRCNG